LGLNLILETLHPFHTHHINIHVLISLCFDDGDAHAFIKGHSAINNLCIKHRHLSLELPVVIAAVDFTTSSAMKFISLTFVINDQDERKSQDPNIAKTVEHKNYGRLGMPIRTPLT
jgi:hypothetical protein